MAKAGLLFVGTDDGVVLSDLCADSVWLELDAGVPRVATALPQGLDCPVEDLPPGTVKIVRAGEIAVGVYNLGGDYYAIEDRCSHDDGPLCEGDFDVDEGYAVCPRHGAHIDIRSGRPLTLPAVLPVETFPVRVIDGMVTVDIS